MRVGIVSGHNIPEITEGFEEISVETRFGKIDLLIGEYRNKEVVFLNRHQGRLPPHRINYLANVEAMKLSKVDSIFSFGTVGSLNPNIRPGFLVIPDDFIDFTKNRRYSFFDDSRTHIDMSDPFCPYLRKVLIDTCKELEVDFCDRGVYLSTEGPRLETKAEIRLFSNYADIVGMTLVPEVVLAREKEMCYGAICLVCNMASGIQGSLSAEEIKRFFNEKKKIVSDILGLAISKIEDKRDCRCREALKEARL
mgnify:CR=1 FL=1